MKEMKVRGTQRGGKGRMSEVRKRIEGQWEGNNRSWIFGGEKKRSLAGGKEGRGKGGVWETALGTILTFYPQIQNLIIPIALLIVPIIAWIQNHQS